MEKETESEVLLKCLEFLFIDRPDSQVTLTVSGSQQSGTPDVGCASWKQGAVTKFMKAQGFSKENDPNDDILSRLLRKPKQPVQSVVAELPVPVPLASESGKRKEYTVKLEKSENCEPVPVKHFSFKKTFRGHFASPRYLQDIDQEGPNDDVGNNSYEVLPESGGKRKREPGITITTPTLESCAFKSAKDQLIINDAAKGIKRFKEKSPVRDTRSKAIKATGIGGDPENVVENQEVAELMLDERLKNLDPKMVEAVLNEVIEVGTNTEWDDIAGLKLVKDTIKEIIIWPILRPDIFNGLRGPPKGILLFGPPGTGKTLLGRLIATKSNSTFFNISASSLTSKWIGDGEKMVRALFQVARVKQPAVIFIDEIDSILTQRSDTEHESSRRLKTEFLIQFDGCGSKTEDRILVIGVTNRPQELDEAARRRLVKRIYIPLPDFEGRRQLVHRVVDGQQSNLSESDYDEIARITDGYSGADMASLCKEAAYGPIRDIGHDIENICADKVRSMTLEDFVSAVGQVKASVLEDDLILYENWDKQFGCCQRIEPGTGK